MKNLKTATILIIMLIMNSFATIAQEMPGEVPTGEDGLDPPAAPITDYLWILGVIGLMLVFYKHYHTAKQKSA